ncbi:metalloregulator ArsR/SmtB family transcription factor [Paenibacillus sp. FSL W8-0187]|uniref:ArsR/SmtB family transcription factor n=1 Tax=Paenibacillus TaxID=44249 RepID=UPI001BE8A572|nr:metalloregulator ArsR/SmtB family transcription factor [Paenibacillus sp. ISL-20]MBT2759824.1 winged helix-turn-helix transcriptional regulator [Paenibacillus sp. ISL-20]
MKQTTLNALAEPNRLQIVELLRDGPLTVSQVADRLKIRQPQTSKHLKILHEAGLVEVQAEANRRIYRLRPEPLQEMDEWLESFRGIWEQRLDQLEDYLDKLQKKG